MDSGRAVVRWVSGLGSRRLDELLAAGGVAGALWNAASEPHRRLNALAVAALVALMGTVAWRRVDPVATTLAAAASLIVFPFSSWTRPASD